MSGHAAMVLGFSLLGAVLLPTVSARGPESTSSFRLDYEVWLLEGGKVADELERLTGSPDEVAAGARTVVKSEGFRALNGHFSMAASTWVTATAPLASRNADATAADGINGGNDPGGRSVLYAQCERASTGGIAISLRGNITLPSGAPATGDAPPLDTSVFECASTAPSGAERVHIFDPGSGAPRVVLFATAMEEGDAASARPEDAKVAVLELRGELWRIDDAELAHEIEKSAGQTPQDLNATLRKSGKASRLVGLRSPLLPVGSATVGFSDEEPINGSAGEGGAPAGFSKTITTLALAIRRGDEGMLIADVRARVAEPLGAGAKPSEPTTLTMRLDHPVVASRLTRTGDPHVYLVLLVRGDGQ